MIQPGMWPVRSQNYQEMEDDLKTTKAKLALTAAELEILIERFERRTGSTAVSARETLARISMAGE